MRSSLPFRKRSPEAAFEGSFGSGKSPLGGVSFGLLPPRPMCFFELVRLGGIGPLNDRDLLKALMPSRCSDVMLLPRDNWGFAIVRSAFADMGRFGRRPS